MIPDKHKSHGTQSEGKKLLLLASCILPRVFYTGAVSFLIGFAGSGSCPSANGRLKM